MRIRRVMRGGSYYFESWGLRTVSRNRVEPGGRDTSAGFRISVHRRNR